MINIIDDMKVPKVKEKYLEEESDKTIKSAIIAYADFKNKPYTHFSSRHVHNTALSIQGWAHEYKKMIRPVLDEILYDYFNLPCEIVELILDQMTMQYAVKNRP
tara:strand:+ start:655 stop:966 length:312 start_codon:yes stop_codon:yes gene_type:complete